jgi:meso-butanediol dehydrogenase / (S,S)-butanediol dehydrogenase / diacetyl reductase
MIPLRFDAQVAIVTGAGSGIGAATAAVLAGQGARVVCADRNADAAVGVAETLNATAVCVDVSDAEDMQRLVQETERRHGGVDILINNAGVWFTSPDGYQSGVTDAPSPLLSEDVWQRTIDTNLKSVYLGCRFAIPAIQRRGGGAIVNVASVAAYRVGSGASDAYTAAKGGVLAITRTLAVEHAPAVRVNAVVPGPVLTAMTASAAAANFQDLAPFVPMGRFGEPQEVAWMIAFLCSRQASFCTGGAYLVDGGYTAK